MRVLHCLLGLAILSTCSAKGASGPGGGGGCDRDLTGSWSISGSCTPSSCVVTQRSCSFSIQCDDGTQLSGSVSGSSFNGTAATRGGNYACTGALTGGGISGSCASTTGAASCTFAASCRGGACGASSATPDAATTSPCAAATSCGACSAMGSCGWCYSGSITEGVCLEGTSSGATAGSCPEWAWTSSQCVAQ